MSLQRIWILLSKELRQGATNIWFIYSLVTPVVLSLLVALVFGDLLAQTPRLGIYDADGASRVSAALLAHDSINTTQYPSEAALKAAVTRGTVEMGLSLAPGFDAAVRNGGTLTVAAYRWGEIGVRNYLLLESATGRAFINALDVELPVSVNSEQIGSANTSTWSQRLLPLIILMAIMLGGLLIPASSLIEEKQKRTLVALTTTPTSLLDVYLAKTLVGIMISAVMGIVILLLNNGFGNQPLLLLMVVTLGAIMASAIGIILGSLVRDMDAFMGAIKAFGIILFAPGILQVFPNLPQWISRLFPTYYVMNPLLEVSQNGAGFGSVAGELAILVAIVAGLLVILSRVIQRQQQQLALAS